LPVPAYNAFTRAMDRLNALDRGDRQPVRSETYSPEEFQQHPWPLRPGDYQVFRPRASTAVLILGTPPGLAPATFAGLDEVAMAGHLCTENIGIEYVVKNCLANPHLRQLALVGPDIPGHRPGDALLNLAANGVDKSGRIIGALGGRPMLMNLLPVEIEHFRAQIAVYDLMGATDPAGASKRITATILPAVPPFSQGLAVTLVEPSQAAPAKRLQLDPAGYFIILPRPGSANPLYVEHYKNDGRLAHIVEGPDAATLCAALLDLGLVTRLDHAGYLGRELTKAEASLSSGKKYVQDRAQGEIPRGSCLPTPSRSRATPPAAAP